MADAQGFCCGGAEDRQYEAAAHHAKYWIGHEIMYSLLSDECLVEIILDGDEDYDGDGVSNKQEFKSKTDPFTVE